MQVEQAKCPNCGKMHEIKYGSEKMHDGTLKPSKLLGFVKCNKNAYIVSIAGQIIK